MLHNGLEINSLLKIRIPPKRRINGGIQGAKNTGITRPFFQNNRQTILPWVTFVNSLVTPISSKIRIPP